ncbi:MAG: hypothetical protein ACOVQ7_18080 [Limnoraphis robusta]
MMIKNRFKFFLFQVICQNGNTLIEKLATLITEGKANLAHHIDSIRGKNMNISDLNHLEVVSEEANVEGGYYGYYQSANANAYANANTIAIGSNPYAYTSTSTNTFVQGNSVAGASSASNSGASTSSGYYY